MISFTPLPYPPPTPFHFPHFQTVVPLLCARPLRICSKETFITASAIAADPLPTPNDEPLKTFCRSGPQKQKTQDVGSRWKDVPLSSSVSGGGGGGERDREIRIGRAKSLPLLYLTFERKRRRKRRGAGEKKEKRSGGEEQTGVDWLVLTF